MKLGKHEITPRHIIVFFSGFIVFFNVYTLAWLPPAPYLYRGTFLAGFIIISFFLHVPKSKAGKIFMGTSTALALIGTIYPMVFEERLITQFFRAEMIDVYFFIVFIVGFVPVMARTGGGRIMLVLVTAGVIYLLLGHHLPGYFGHKPFDLKYITTVLYTDLDQGTFGFYTEVNCRLISIFMVFAAFLVSSGLGDVFVAIATWMAGSATGGPAKVSIFSSGMFGMLSGSPVANVAATGSFTIPLMKRIGYTPSMAASVEALASTGGNLMPPIMGIGAFLMADILGIPYLQICVAAIVPVFLWYFTCYFTVHHYAQREKIRRWRPTKEEVVVVIKEKGHLILAIFGLLGGLYFLATAEQAGLWAFVFLFILANMRKATRINKAKTADFLEKYARMFVPLFILVIGIGIMIACITGSGVHVKLGTLIFAGIKHWYLMLAITAAIVIVLGMAIPIAASYLAAVVIVAPILVHIEPNLLIIHFFVFYFATISPITPPVCMASFTGARIAGSDMMKTGLEASIKGLPLWIFPFAIFRNRLMFTVGTPLSEIMVGVAILCLGTYVFIVGAEGYFRRPLSWPERIVAMATGIMIAQPISVFYSRVFIVIGAVLLLFWFVASLVRGIRAKRQRAVTDFDAGSQIE